MGVYEEKLESVMLQQLKDVKSEIRDMEDREHL
jgi:hypothetical protein